MQRTHRADDEHFRTDSFRRRLRRRDRDAWDELYRTYASRVEGVARRVLPARLDPEAAAQESWAKALDKARTFGRRSASRKGPYAWLCSICINHCIALLRRDRVGRGPRLRASLTGAARLRAFVGAAPSGGRRARPDTPAGPWQQEALRRAVSDLSRRRQEAIYLRYACGLETKEIAVLVGATDGAVRQRLSRAFQDLRQAVKRASETDTPGGEGDERARP